MALKKQATPKRWRSKEAKEIVAAVQRRRASGAHCERAPEDHRASRFRRRRLSAQRRPCRWARRPQHPGHHQEQDRATGLNRSAQGGASGGGRARRAGIVAVVPAELTMGLAFAYTLELPQKLAYEAATWTQLQHSLYRYFAVIDGPLEVATIIAAVVFALRARVG
jgi:hypothetical protein